ncbi:6815_t:CDS:1, partial [Cetraspora pellucida]
KMEPTLYRQIKRYLQDSHLSRRIEEFQRKKIIRISKTLELEQGLLYKWDKLEPTRLLRVAQEQEIDAILMMAHMHSLGGHFGVEAVYDKIRRIYDC